VRTTRADLVHLLESRSKIPDPRGLVLADESDTPGQRFAATPSHASVDEGVKNLTFTEAQAGHHRDTGHGEVHRGVITACTPAHVPAEGGLSFLGDPHPLVSRILSEPADPGPGGRRPLIVAGPFDEGRSREGTDYEDLVIVDLDPRGLFVPSGR
jgi:hypothetical protein